MNTLSILGPQRLVGTVHVAGAKNAALPALAATLLASEAVTLERIPRVTDTATMLDLLTCLGVEVRREGEADCLVPSVEPDRFATWGFELMRRIRASILVLGPLVARRGRARVALPGGCAIGTRPIDEHLRGLSALGAEVRVGEGAVEVTAPGGLRGSRFRFSTPSVTATENLLMAASLARGTSILEGCAQEPEIGDLVRLLRGMGADLEEIAPGTWVVRGVRELGGARHRVIGDRIEAGTYLIGAAMTGGDVRVLGAEAAHLRTLLGSLAAMGVMVEAEGSSIRARQGARLRAHHLTTAPYPGFPTDLQAQLMALMTQAEGVSTVCEAIFENRFQHVPELRCLGAEICVEGPRAMIRGGSRLLGTRVRATDLRASAALVLAALVARGETRVDAIHHLDRGYEAIDTKLQALGARVRRVGSPTAERLPQAARFSNVVGRDRWPLATEDEVVEAPAMAVEVVEG